MIKTEEGYRFENTGREFSVHGSDGISITFDGIVRYGYDGFVEFWNENTEEFTSDFTENEKKELAIFMIEKWSKFGGLPNGGKTKNSLTRA